MQDLARKILARFADFLQDDFYWDETLQAFVWRRSLGNLTSYAVNLSMAKRLYTHLYGNTVIS